MDWLPLDETLKAPPLPPPPLAGAHRSENEFTEDSDAMADRCPGHEEPWMRG